MSSTRGALRLTVLGSGTSVGVPTIGCQCKVCTSADPRDKRLRPSVFVRHKEYGILIDTSPDFRYQALRAGIERIDAILYTHAHADHILGLDDVRPFNFHQRGSIPIFAADDHLEVIRRCFSYIFDGRQSQSSKPKIEVHQINGLRFNLFGLEVTPLRLPHGDHGFSYGFRMGSLAYLTDHSDIPEEVKPHLRGLDVLFLDALRYKPHPTHSTIERSLQHVEELKPKLAVFTHIGHDILHERAESMLPPHVRLAYDGMELNVEWSD